ncbi:potassium transporter KefB [Emticicia sp. C21]|uniref:potassium transporter KefB n=1 Tax=Emticicia sp. C21 TaxID=2302915 RepID=UPI000E35689C|nr:potassium transporter KefB [Emticicia sp. C21]RFS14358.1 potassium transporter KefB [Emticicia sp. C21]
MTAKNNLTMQHLVIKRALIGAAIGLVVISCFILSVNNPKPEWGQYWMIRPFIVTPLVVALAGICTSFLASLGNNGGIKRIIAYTLTILIYFFSLWFGIVAGLGGTLWD